MLAVAGHTQEVVDGLIHFVCRVYARTCVVLYMPVGVWSVPVMAYMSENNLWSEFFSSNDF